MESIEREPYRTHSDFADVSTPIGPAAPVDWRPPVEQVPVAASPPRPPLPPQSSGRQRPAGRWVAIPALSLALGVGGGAIAGSYAAGSGSADVVAADAATVSAVDSTSVAIGVVDVPSIIDAVDSSVVSISTEIEVRQGRFNATAVSAGTGIVYDDAGHVITNAHVVEGATSIVVTTEDGRELEAELIGADPAADIAVLAVQPIDDLQPAELADADSTSVGDPVVAIGNALALDGSLTVTQGIISALDRSIETEAGELTHLLQTDAAISSGNSGGPLVNTSGQVVGVNTAVAASSGTTTASNIGFAITVDRAVEIANGLIAG